MTNCCPNCGHRLDAPVESPVEALERACRDRGVWVSPDGRVSEADAAELLGRATATLANWSYADQPLPFVKVRGRRTYRLADVANMLAADE